ncbi:MAG: hypothetical protein IT462_03340 [Planctomycetes bacterium]|nr:hypothetical protein [Planctomycetota bacterium]
MLKRLIFAWPLTLLLLALPALTRAEDAPADPPQETPPEQPETKPGRRTYDRAARDWTLLSPQTCLGGDPDAKMPGPGKTATFSEFKVECEGANGIVAYKYVLNTLAPGKKYPLMFTFHGNGESGKGNVSNLGPLMMGADPCLVCGMQYQQLEADGKTKFNNPRNCDMDGTCAAARWVLEKMIKDYPIDTERVFVGGFSMGTLYSSYWTAYEWSKDPETFPFRGLILFSSPGVHDREKLPPIPVVCTVGSEEVAVLGTVNVVENVRSYCNLLNTWGIPNTYHEIPKMGHGVNARCICIARDLINQCGGPGLQWKPAGVVLPDPLPFKSDDAGVRELIGFCAADDWVGARKRIAEIWENKKLKTKERQPAKDFEKEMDKFAKSEISRLEKEIDKAIKAKEFPKGWHVARLKALVEAYKDETWMKGKDPLAIVRKAESDEFPPCARENERRELWLDALDCEKTDKRADARKLYEDLAKRKAEDNGASLWPKAAEYRLTWWTK